MISNIQASDVIVTIVATIYLCDTDMFSVRHYEHIRNLDVILLSESKIGYLQGLSLSVDLTSLTINFYKIFLVIAFFQVFHLNL